MSAPTTSNSTRPEMPSPTPSAKRQNSGNSVKKALATLKRRGSKLLSRRASTPGTMSTALVHSPSRSPSGSLRSRSRSPSPTPASKQRPSSSHVRARTTSFGFSLTRGLRKNSSSSGVNDAGLPASSASPHVPNKLRKPSSLRSLRSDATTAVDSLTATSSEFGPHSPLLFKDPSSPPGKDMKLSLDMSRTSEGSIGKMPTIYSAMPQTDDEEAAEDETKKDLFFSEPVYEEREPEAEAPVVVETPEAIEETAAVVDTPEPIEEAAPAIATPEPIVEEAPVLAEEVPLPTDDDEDLVIVTEEEAVPAPAAEPIAEVSSTSEPEVSVPAPQEPEQLAPAPATPSAASLVSLPSTPITVPAPLVDRPASPAASASSDEEEEVLPELPALVLPTMIMPIPNVRTLLSTVMGAPFFTLHWWLHPLLPIV